MKQLQGRVRADVLREVLSLIARRGEAAPRAQRRQSRGTRWRRSQRASDLRQARAWIRTASVALATALTLVFISCSGDEPGGEQVSRIAQALPSSTNAGVLGFEDHTQWSGASQNSSVHSEGQLSAVVPVNGWTEVTSIALDSLGEVDDELTVDLQLPAEVGWGEARVIVVLPSQNEHYRELGSEPLGGLAAGEFHRLSFAIPADLATKLAASYSDLTFRVVINAPPGDYLLDRLWLWDESPDEQGGGGAGGEAGAGGAPPTGGGDDAGGTGAVSSCVSGLGFRVQYRDGSQNPTDQHLKPHLRIVNDSDAAAALSEFVMRYWYTSEGSGPQNYAIDYSSVSGVSVQFYSYSPAVPGADSYLDVLFSSGTVAAGESSGEHQVRTQYDNWDA